MLVKLVVNNLPKAPHILLFVTFFVLLTHLLSGDRFGYVNLFAYFTSIFYVTVFTVSFYIFLLVFILGEKNSDKSFVVYIPTRLTNFAFAISIVSFFVMYIIIMGFEYDSFLGLRNKLIGLYRADDVSSEFKILNTAGLFIFFFASYLYLVSVNNELLYAVSALIFPIFMINRNFLLIFTIIALIKMICLQKRLLATLFICFVFFVFNMLYVYIYDKGDEDLGILMATLLSVMEYLTLPLHGLTFSLDNPRYYGDFLTFPSAIVSWFGYNVDREYIYTPYPNQTNVYTLFYSVLYDFGIWGIGFFGLILGAFHSYLYHKSKNNSLFVFVYIYSLYPVLMTFFDNTYTTSLGVWFYIFLPFLFLKKSERNYRVS